MRNIAHEIEITRLALDYLIHKEEIEAIVGDAFKGLEFTHCEGQIYGANYRYHMQCKSYAGHDGPCTLHPDPKGCPNA